MPKHGDNRDRQVLIQVRLLHHETNVDGRDNLLTDVKIRKLKFDQTHDWYTKDNNKIVKSVFNGTTSVLSLTSHLFSSVIRVNEEGK